MYKKGGSNKEELFTATLLIMHRRNNNRQEKYTHTHVPMWLSLVCAAASHLVGALHQR